MNHMRLLTTGSLGLALLSGGCSVSEKTSASQAEATTEDKAVVPVAAETAKPAPADARPNILWIVTDDQRADSISCYNQATTGQKNGPLGRTDSPNVDQLAKEGVLFTNAFCQSPGCAPSRASMHTGRYPHHSGIYGFSPHHDKAEHWEKWFPQILSDNGYQTIQSGKLGVRTLGWNGKGFDWSMAYKKYDAAFHFREAFHNTGRTDWLKDGNSTVEQLLFEDGKVVSFNIKNPTEADLKARKEFDKKQSILRYYNNMKPNGSKILAGEATKSKDQCRDYNYYDEIQRYLNNADKDYKTSWGGPMKGPDSSKPIMINLGFDFPHTPVLPPKEFRDKFKNEMYKIPKLTQKEKDSWSEQVQNLYKHYGTDHFTDEEKLAMIRDYYAYCAYGDWIIGKAVKGFKEYSEKQNRPWMIVYVCGDHGWSLNDHGKIEKFSMWGIDIRTPMIVVSSDKKKFPAGKVVKDMVELVDIAPTCLNAAELDTTKKEFDYLDGFDLADVVKGTKKRGYIIGESDMIWHRGYMRTERFGFSMMTRKMGRANGQNIKWAVNASRKDVQMALYDLENDPGETNNVADDPRYAKLADWFRIRLQNILLGDNRVEVQWKSGLNGKVFYSNFAPGAHDRKDDVPKELIPQL